MFQLKRVCGLAMMVLAVAAMGGAASNAQASVTPRVRAMRAARVLFSRSLTARLRAHIRPMAGASVSPGTDLLLFTDPVRMQVHGLVYRMSMHADTTVDQFGTAPELSVGFDRTSRGVSGRINGVQEHVYGFSSTDMVMTADQGLTGLHIDTRRSFRPTRVTMNLVPDEVRSASCRLFFGGNGTQSVAEGTLDTSVFRIHTGTWPYFGNVTAAPQTGVAIADPGCLSGGVGGVAFGRTVRRYYEPCQGRESVVAGSLFGDTSGKQRSATAAPGPFSVRRLRAAPRPNWWSISRSPFSPRRACPGRNDLRTAPSPRLARPETRCSAVARHSCRTGVRRCQRCTSARSGGISATSSRRATAAG